MESRVIRPRMKGFVALDAHPGGCAANVERLVDRLALPGGGDGHDEGSVVVIGSSGGYGLPATVAAGFRRHVPVVGVCLERPADSRRSASAGWYNVAALHRVARAAGARIETVNADCFADETKDAVVERLGRVGPASLLIYSVAAPASTDPSTGVTHRSTLKPIGAPFATKTVKIDTGEIADTVLQPATDDEINSTVKVMGGEDWARWVDALSAGGVLAADARTVAFSYVGPAMTQAIYRAGTIGWAKAHLEETAHRLHDQLSAAGGGAWVSVNAAAVTQSSSAIPAVPLYLSLLLRAAGEASTLELPAEQMRRLFDDHLHTSEPLVDDQRLIRLDGWELDPALQDEIATRWNAVASDNFGRLGDFPAFRTQFRQLFGFDVAGLDYEQPVDPDVPL